MRGFACTHTYTLTSTLRRALKARGVSAAKACTVPAGRDDDQATARAATTLSLVSILAAPDRT